MIKQPQENSTLQRLGGCFLLKPLRFYGAQGAKSYRGHKGSLDISSFSVILQSNEEEVKRPGLSISQISWGSK